MTEVFLRLGVPKTIHSDQGPGFQGDLMKAICELLEVNQTRTTPYHPQSDGQVERFNRTLIAMLSKLCADQPRDWDDHLPYTTCAYRATIQESTGCSPNMLMLGRDISLPIDLMYPVPQTAACPFSCPVQYVEWVREAMKGNFALARDHLERSAERQKRYYDMGTRDRIFKDGDLVLRFYRPNMVSNKLGTPYVGPFKVMK